METVPENESMPPLDVSYQSHESGYQAIILLVYGQYPLLKFEVDIQKVSLRSCQVHAEHMLRLEGSDVYISPKDRKIDCDATPSSINVRNHEFKSLQLIAGLKDDGQHVIRQGYRRACICQFSGAPDEIS